MGAPPPPWTVTMQCQTCGDPTSPAFNECQRCGTPLGQPAVTPGLATYGVRGLGLATSVAVCATTVLYLPGALFPVVGGAMARRAAAQADSDLLLGAAVAEGLLTLPYFLAYLTAAVLLIVWTWRARKNTDAFPGALPSLSPAWAIAGWLVPFANLVVPARVMANIARDSLWRRRPPPLVALWWIAWLGFSIGDGVVNSIDTLQYAEVADTPRNAAEFQEYVSYYQYMVVPRLIPAVFCLIAGVSLIVLLRRISAAQQDRIDRAVPAWPYHPGWPVPGAPAAYAPRYPVQPVTGSSPQVVADPTVASPQVPPEAGGTIGA
ncbi:DUF4328 domain-containing protein [Micromonospora sp. NPDC007271]|uniref:DUF4328 domain-containing protein n=1 Tax=Micromonospora sp. NPDC007271 TaxID=3154587 RepID=UPI0033C447CF